ncbi:uncharacterized protein [Procambarus clarkii]|uniref:uncharacterized protein isoform X5 n=1 Tax=Procambarus clarkii TaxID=6728 RepID=UPI003741F553
MGACIARCWPLIADPRYHPVRGRYFIQDDTVQARQPRRLSSLTSRLGALISRLRPKAEDEVELTPHLEPQDASDPPTVRPSSRVAPMNGGEPRWWGINRVPGSLPSLTEPDSPPTTSIDLEWEPEAGLARNSRDSLGGEEEASQTAESSSWVQRSSSSTPNSLEWDFRASTLSLRGGLEDETWHHTDMETEQLLQEIEQLAARALADTGHGLQPPPR